MPAELSRLNNWHDESFSYNRRRSRCRGDCRTRTSVAGHLTSQYGRTLVVVLLKKYCVLKTSRVLGPKQERLSPLRQTKKPWAIDGDFGWRHLPLHLADMALLISNVEALADTLWRTRRSPGRGPAMLFDLMRIAALLKAGGFLRKCGLRSRRKLTVAFHHLLELTL